MIEPIKKIKVRGGVAIIYNTGQTQYENEKGEVVATLPFPVDEKVVHLCLIAYEAGYERGVMIGECKGLQDILDGVYSPTGGKAK